jgi:hypothetical protein
MNVAGSPFHMAVGADAEFPRADALSPSDGEDGLEVEPFVAVAGDVGHRFTVFGSVAASVKPHEVAQIVQRGERPDDPGTISGGALIAFQHITLATEYTNRDDAFPWRLDSGPVVTPAVIFRPTEHWEFAVGTPMGWRAGQRHRSLAMHLVSEF